MWAIVGKLQQHQINCILASVFSLVLAGCSGSVEPVDDGVVSESMVSHEAGRVVSESDFFGNEPARFGTGLEGDVLQSAGTSGDAGSSGPAVRLTASDLSVTEGGSVTLSWSAIGADSCSASGGWAGQLNTSGSQTVGPMVAGTTYSLSCSGPGGTALQMISVAVVGPVELSWIAPEENADGSELVDLAGYRLYYGESSRDYSEVIELLDAAATSHTLDLPTGDYFFAMTAFDSEGHESSYSNEVKRYRP